MTLQALGLADGFASADVVGRDEAPPKPAPGGLLHLAAQWQVAPQALVMVGDYLFDLECAHAAGAHGLLVNLPENPWPELSAGHWLLGFAALNANLLSSSLSSLSSLSTAVRLCERIGSMMFVIGRLG